MVNNDKIVQIFNQETNTDEELRLMYTKEVET
jgi:hypothetical protein